jgi:hypothetical protein
MAIATGREVSPDTSSVTYRWGPWQPAHKSSHHEMNHHLTNRWSRRPPYENDSSVFVTRPWRGLSFSRELFYVSSYLKRLVAIVRASNLESALCREQDAPVSSYKRTPPLSESAIAPIRCGELGTLQFP